MASLAIEQEPLTIEQASALAEQAFDRDWDEALAYNASWELNQARKFESDWDAALSFNVWWDRNQAWSRQVNADFAAYKLTEERCNANPAFRLVTYDCQALSDRLKKGKRKRA